MIYTAKKVQRLRKRTGLSQRAFAKLLGVGYASVYRWESGVTTPTALAQLRLHDAERAWKATILQERLLRSHRRAVRSLVPVDPSRMLDGTDGRE